MAKNSKPATSSTPQPPYIKRVHLCNVPPLRDVKADFKPGVNIIIGKNGSGKTNFMKLLSDLANPFKKNYEGQGSELTISGKHEVSIQFDKKTDAIIDNDFASQLSNERVPLLAVVTSEGETKSAELATAAISTSIRLDFVYFVVSVWHGVPNHRIPILDEGVEMSLSREGRITISNSRFPLRKVSSRLVEAFMRTINNAYYKNPLFENSAENVTLEEIHNTIAESIDRHLKRLESYIKQYSPLQGVQRSGQFQIYRNTSKGEIIVKGLVLEYNIAGEWLPYSALSDGTKRIFYIITELLTLTASIWNKERKIVNLIKVDEIILIEEPELGIHPDQLQLLLQLIREVSREHQVILTTHSPQTLDMLSGQELDRITICEYIPGKGTQMRKLSAAKKTKAKAYLKDDGFLSEFWRFSNLEAPD